MTTSIQERPLTDLIEWASQNPAQTEQLAYDMTRLMQVTKENIDDIKGKPFFSRVLSRVTGSDAQEQIQTNEQLLELQKLTQQRLLDIQKSNLLTAEAVIGVQNNLNTLATKNEETQRQITLMAERVRERFLEMEERVGVLEVNSRIHSWLLTLETYDYDERYPTGLRTLKVIQDFLKIKGNEWNLQEIKFLQKALKEAGLPWKDKISTGKFIDMLVDEIELHDFNSFQELLPLNSNEITTKFVNDNISVATFSALYQIVDKYQHSADTIEILQDSMELTRSEAIRMVLRKFVKKQGVDLDLEIPLKDIAVEILSCTALATSLTSGQKKNLLDSSLWECDIEQLRETGDEAKVKALRHYFGIATPIDFHKAFTLFQNSSTQNCTISGWFYAECLQNGYGTSEDAHTAIKVFSELKVKIQKLASEGDSWAQWITYIEDDSADISHIDISHAARIRNLEQSANQGNVIAMEDLATNYWESQHETAVALLKASASRQYAHAISELAEYEYHNGNVDESFQLYSVAANQNHSEALHQLALCYLNGVGTEKNIGQAKELARKSYFLGEMKAGVSLYILGGLDVQKLQRLIEGVLESGDSEVMVDLGKALAESLEDEAESLFHGAHLLGDAEAKYQLALLQESTGRINQYKMLMEESVRLNNINALIHLGKKYYQGSFPYERTPLKSFELFELAVKAQGSDIEEALAYYWLGRLHYYGYGTHRDYVSAFNMLTKSVELGGEGIKEFESCSELRKMAYEKMR